MSAFVLLAAHQLAAMLQTKIDRKKRAVRSSNASHSLSNSSLHRNNTRTSHGSGSLHDRNPHRKVYDIDLATYVQKHTFRSVVDKKIEEHERTCATLNGVKYRERNAHMNRYTAGGRRIFTASSVQMLRYSYFQDFVGDTAFVTTQMHNRKADGRSTLRFGRKLEKILAGDDRVVRNKRCAVYGNVGDDFDTSDDDSDSTVFCHSRKLSQMGGANVRALIKSNHFWNDVYQDLKFYSIQNKSSVNYFDLLPSINQTTTFFGDILDHFLYHLQVHSISEADLKGEDVGALKDYDYFYFRDGSCQFLREQAKSHQNVYDTQAKMNHSMSSPISHTFDLDREELGIHRFLVHKDMMAQLVETVIENLRSNFSIAGQRADHNQTEALLDLWRHFLRYVIFEELLTQIEAEDASDSEYPEPDIDTKAKSAKDKHVFRSSMELVNPQIRFTSPPSVKERSGSISSRTTDFSAVSTASLSSHMSSMSSPSTMSSPALRIRGSVESSIASGGNALSITENINFPYQATAPKMYFTEKTDKKKKKLIFDKFKKTKPDE